MIYVCVAGHLSESSLGAPASQRLRQAGACVVQEVPEEVPETPREEAARAPVMPTHIRRASPSDAEQIAGVLLAAFSEFEALYTPSGFSATTPSPSEIIRRLVEGPTWIAQEGETVVGTVSALNRGEEVYIRSMAVLPTERGRGTATQLLTVVHAFAISQGTRRLSLTTTPFLSAAIQLYERTGFRRTSGALDLHGTPLFAMVKELDTVPNRRLTSTGKCTTKPEGA